MRKLEYYNETIYEGYLGRAFDITYWKQTDTVELYDRSEEGRPLGFKARGRYPKSIRDLPYNTSQKSIKLTLKLLMGGR